MILEFNNKLINSNSIKYIGKVDDPDVESEIQRIDKQIEVFTPKGWRSVLETPIDRAIVEMLQEEKENLIQQFHIDIFFVDNSELRESYPTKESRDKRFKELKNEIGRNF